MFGDEIYLYMNEERDLLVINVWNQSALPFCLLHRSFCCGCVAGIGSHHPAAALICYCEMKSRKKMTKEKMTLIDLVHLWNICQNEPVT